MCLLGRKYRIECKYLNFVWVEAAEQKHLNDALGVRGLDVEIEAHETASRCFERDDGAWLRCFGMVVRNFSRADLAKILDRVLIVQNEKRGYPFSIEELEVVLMDHKKPAYLVNRVDLAH